MDSSYNKMSARLQTGNSKASKKPEISNADFSQLLPIMNATNVPAMSVSTINGNNIVVGQVGVANITLNDNVTEQTNFAAASLSKLPFVYLIIKLIEQGKLEPDFLTQPLYKILPTHQPFFESSPENAIDFSKSEEGRALTAEKILSHQTQLPNWIEKDKPTFNSPGFNYSGEGFYYLQKILEEKIGVPFEKIMQELLDDLGMHNTTYITPKTNMHLAVGHDEAGVPHGYFQGTSRANVGGSMSTTATDYAIFLHACLNYDLLHDYLKKCPLIDVIHDNKPLLAWGLGWGVQDTDEGRILFLWGSGPNVKNFTAMNLDKKTAMVFFTNSENGLSSLQEMVDIVNNKIGKVDKIVEFLKDDNLYQHNTPGWKERHEGLAQENKGNFALAKTFFEKALELFPKDEKSKQHLNLLSHIDSNIQPATTDMLEKYQGQYGPLRITHNNNKLELEVNGEKHLLIQIANHTFLDNDDKVILKFNPDAEKTLLHCTSLAGNPAEFSKEPIVSLQHK